MNRIKVWPHITIIAVVVALIAGLGVAFWMRHEQTASAAQLPYAARIQRVDGEVAFSNGLANADGNAEWTAATVNQPFSVGDRIYTRENARTLIAFNGRNFARLQPNTSLDVVSLEDRRTQLALRDGSAIFDVGYLAPNELFEVATPYGAVDFDQPGLYNVGFDNNGSVLVSVLSGLARVVGLSGSGEINKGEMLTLVGETAAEIALSRLNNQDAGYLIDDYYRYQYPNDYDGRYNNYDAYIEDPYYYDPYRRDVSYQYVSSNIPGVNDLDYYGDWQKVDGYGYVWRPRVEANWVPYQQGYWTNDYPYGMTWVSSEPWGYAPYHYGRWANVGNQWYWIPDGVNSTASYSPALVAFVSQDDNQIGWIPLGPGDSYAPRYYDDNWQPHYLTQTNVVPVQLINLGIPGAVTIVPLDAFGRVIDPRSIRRIDQQRLAVLRPTLDPFTMTPLRNAVIHSAWGRGKIDLPPGIAKKLNDTPVFVGADIKESKFRKDMAKSMRVERVSDNAKNQKFKVKDEREQMRQVDSLTKQDKESGRNEGLDIGAKKGAEPPNVADAKRNKEAQRQTRQLEQQEKKEVRSQEPARVKTPRNNQQQAQGDRVGMPSQPKNKAASKQAQPKNNGANTPSQPNKGKADGGNGKGKGKP